MTWWWWWWWQEIKVSVVDPGIDSTTQLQNDMADPEAVLDFNEESYSISED